MGLDRIKRKIKKDIKKRRNRGPVAKARKAITGVKETRESASDWRKSRKTPEGFCIDCGRPIPVDPSKPRCYECWKRWSQ